MNKPSKPVVAFKERDSDRPYWEKTAEDFGRCSICYGRLFEGEILRCTPCNKRDVANDEIPF